MKKYLLCLAFMPSVALANDAMMALGMFLGMLLGPVLPILGFIMLIVSYANAVKRQHANAYHQSNQNSELQSNQPVHRNQSSIFSKIVCVVNIAIGTFLALLPAMLLNHNTIVTLNVVAVIVLLVLRYRVYLKSK